MNSFTTVGRRRAALLVAALALGLLPHVAMAAGPARKPAAPVRAPVVRAGDLTGNPKYGAVPAGAVGRAGGRSQLRTANGNSLRGHAPLPDDESTAASNVTATSTDSLRATTTSTEPALSTRTAATATTAPTQALVLYDTTGPYGWLGEMYATATANLSSQFGAWTAKPVSTYSAGDIDRYTATIYIGSTYDEPLPGTFLDDVVNSTRPVVWMYSNVWQLTNRYPDFATRYGWMWDQYDTSPVDTVTYKGVELTRHASNGAGIMRYSAVGPDVQVLATARRADGTTFPWALRSRNLTYIGEIPYAYFSESDRLMAFADLLGDALAPNRPERHRALVRLEDISPKSDPAELRRIADYLAAERVPFSFGVVSRYTDPLGYLNNGTPETVRLDQNKTMVDTLRYLQSKGGVMLEHGWTHQYSNVANPYNGVTGDDTEFYRVIENPDHTLTWVGPVVEDSARWVANRISGAAGDFKRANLTTPTIFEFPHYAGSATSYREVAKRFPTRYERSLYFPGTLTGAARVDHSRLMGQMFPYPVRDVYGTKVLPENIGNVEPEDWFQYKARLPEAIVRDARRNLVVKDGFASFYFHPFFDIRYLRETVQGIKAAGYTFVSPASL